MTKKSIDNLGDILRRISDVEYREAALKRDTARIKAMIAAARERLRARTAESPTGN
jgi:hypothetical protein